MCRNIRTLFNYDPPATDEEVRASATQFVRKLSGFTKPSKANEEAFERAVVEVSGSARRLLDSLVTNASPKNREEEARKRRARFLASHHWRPIRIPHRRNDATGSRRRPCPPSAGLRVPFLPFF
jgi:hypothetical protein